MDERIAKAHQIVKMNLTKVTGRDSKNRPTVVTVPGSEAKQYEVIVRRENGCITTECRLVTGNGYLDCKGNGNGICYHSLAAVVKVAQDGGKKITLSASEKNAKKKNSVVVRVASRKSGKSFYATIKE